MTDVTTRVSEIAEACRAHGKNSIVVLSGVAGTGKSYLADLAAKEVAGHAMLVKPVQFHPSYTYEQFMEGYRPNAQGGFEVEIGPLMEWNDLALADPSNIYVLLIEEFTRANVSAVIGELMTYIEHRDRAFYAPYRKAATRIADNLVVLATMNPRDRSALEIDDALIRRLWIIECPPDTEQLRAMLEDSLDGEGKGPGEAEIINGLVTLFDECATRYTEQYAQLMPFGHGMFVGIRNAADLAALWDARIKHLLKRPLHAAHPFADAISELYPWKSAPSGGAAKATAAIAAAVGEVISGTGASASPPTTGVPTSTPAIAAAGALAPDTTPTAYDSPKSAASATGEEQVQIETADAAGPAGADAASPAGPEGHQGLVDSADLTGG